MARGNQDGSSGLEGESGLVGKEPLLSAAKAMRAARKAGVSELAVAIVGDMAVWCAGGYTEAEWREELASRRGESRDEVEGALAEIRDAGLWPWQ